MLRSFRDDLFLNEPGFLWWFSCCFWFLCSLKIVAGLRCCFCNAHDWHILFPLEWWHVLRLHPMFTPPCLIDTNQLKSNIGLRPQVRSRKSEGTLIGWYESKSRREPNIFLHFSQVWALRKHYGTSEKHSRRNIEAGCRCCNHILLQSRSGTALSRGDRLVLTEHLLKMRWYERLKLAELRGTLSCRCLQFCWLTFTKVFAGFKTFKGPLFLARFLFWTKLLTSSRREGFNR